MIFNKYIYLLKNTFIFSLGTFGSSAIGLLMLPIFTRVLTKSDYGQLDIILTTISLLLPIITLDVIQAVFRFTLDDITIEQKRKILSSCCIILFILILSLIILYLPLTYIFKVFYNYYIFFIIIFIIQFLNGILKTFIRAEKKILLFAISDIVYTFLFASFGIFFVVVMKYGLSGYLIATVTALMITTLLIIIFGKIYIYIRIRSIDINTLRKMIKYSIPLIPNGLSWWIMVSSDRYMLVYFLNYGAAGIYSVANKFPLMITLLNSIFYQAWQISSIEEYKNKDKTVFYSNVFRYLYTVIFGAIILISFILKPLTILMLGADFKTAWIYIPFLVMGVAFHSFSSFYGVGYLASKKTGGAFRTSMYGAITNIGINLVFIPLIGIQAASISTCLGFLVMWLVRLIETRKYLNIKVRWNHFLSLLMLSAASLFIIYIDTYFILIGQIIFIITFIIIIKKQFFEIMRFGSSMMNKVKG